MSNVYNQMRIADKILDARTAMKRFYSPAEYAKRTDDWKGLVKKVMVREKCTELEAVLSIDKFLQSKGQPLGGMSMALLLAAVADMIDHSTKEEFQEKYG